MDQHLDISLPYGTDEYFATLFTRPENRAAHELIFTLKNTIESIPLKVSDPGIARLKLAWWKNELEREDSESIAHPALAALNKLSLDHGACRAALLELVVNLDDEYQLPSFKTGDLQRDWFAKSYKKLYEFLLGNSDYATELAAATEGARSLLRLRIECSANLKRCPLSALTQANITWDELHRCEENASILNFMQSEVANSQENLSLLIQRSKLEASSASRYILLTEAALKETRRDGGHLFSRRVELTPIRKLWIAWRNRK